MHYSQCRQRVHNQPRNGTRCSRCNQCLLRCSQCGALLLAACGDATAPRPAMLQHRGHAERLRVRLRSVAAANSALLSHARISHLSVWLSWQSVSPPPTSKPFLYSWAVWQLPWHDTWPLDRWHDTWRLDRWVPLDRVPRESSLQFVAGSHLGPWCLPRSLQVGLIIALPHLPCDQTVLTVPEEP